MEKDWKRIKFVKKHSLGAVFIYEGNRQTEQLIIAVFGWFFLNMVAAFLLIISIEDAEFLSHAKYSSSILKTFFNKSPS